jgi:hypothetical protein
MSLKLNSSGGGSVLLQEPSTASNVTFTLPSETATAIYANSSGNVGIGTSSPSNKLQVSSSGADVARFTNSSSNGGDWQFKIGGGGFEDRRLMITDRFSGADNVRVGIDSSGNLQFNSGYGSAATAYGCRAWVNFNGTGTVAIRASGNVSSITDNGTGDYTVNFTTAMPDGNYCVSVPITPAIGVATTGGAWWGGIATDASGVALTKTSSAIRIKMATYAGPGNNYDTNETNVAIFR